ncbi:MAG: tetratricopeptide repeat protein [Bacteroidales bacterium]|nr:tetratricopeptide repeat protein [Bacteroidales bacterium]
MRNFFIILFLLVITSAKANVTDTSLLSDYFNQNSSQITSDSLLSSRWSAMVDSLDKFDTKAYWFYKSGFLSYSENRYDLALDFFGKALCNYRLANDKDGEATTLNRIGNVYKLKSDYKLALKYYDEALEINVGLNNNVEIARTKSNQASVFQLFGQYEKAMTNYLESLHEYQKVGYKEGVAWINFSIARMKRNIDQVNDAIIFLNKALKGYKNIEDKKSSTRGVRLCYLEMAELFLSQHKTDSSMVYVDKLSVLNNQLNDIFLESNIALLRGKNHFQNNEYTLAEESYKHALSLLSNADNSKNGALIYFGLAQCSFAKKNYSHSNTFALKAFDIATEKNLVSDKKDILGILYLIAKEQEQYKKALEYKEQYAAIVESIGKKEITRLEMNYDFMQQTKETELVHQRAMERQKLYNTIAYLAFLVLFIIAGFIYFIYRQKRKSNELLKKQNAEIQAQRDDLLRKKILIERQNDTITHSIQYASRIQQAVLPSEKTLGQLLTNYFVYFKPRDIVSGDFYWVSEVDEYIMVVAADCTGHGVPGAFMSMMGVTLLNDIVNKERITQPDVLLNKMRSRLIESLNQGGDGNRAMDGMDMSVCRISRKDYTIDFSGAFHPLYIVRSTNGQNEPIIIDSDRMPVGYMVRRNDVPFTTQKVDIKKGDMIYLFSDGYQDQIGGEKGRKLMRANFYALINSLANKPLFEQKEILENRFCEWKGNSKQIDDVMVVGVRF